METLPKTCFSWLSSTPLLFLFEGPPSEGWIFDPWSSQNSFKLPKHGSNPLGREALKIP